MTLTDELDSCGDGNILSNKERLRIIGKFLGVEAKTCNEVPNNGWNMADIKMKVRPLMQAKQNFKEFSDKIACLIFPDNPTL